MTGMGRDGSFGRARRAAVLLAVGLGLSLLLMLPGCAKKGAKQSVDESRAQAFYRLGLRFLQDENLRAAYGELSKAVDLQPRNPIYRNALGLLSLSLGRHESAEEQFKRALKLDPTLTDAHMNLGMVYSETGRFELAAQEYGYTLQDPAYLTPEKAYLNWGLTLLKSGNSKEAEAKFRMAIDASPRYSRGHYELARVIEGAGDLEAALREYQEAWKGLSEVPELNLKLGQLYMELGDGTQARVYFETVIAVAPGSTQAGEARDYLDKIPSR